MAEAARAVRFPTAAVADSGRVGCAIFAFAAANLNGFPCAFAWQPRQVFSVTGRRPASAAYRVAASRRSGMYSLPAPWHDSQPTPSMRSYVVVTAAPGPAAGRVALQAGRRACGSSMTPAFFASSAGARRRQHGVGLRVRAHAPQAQLVAHLRALVAGPAGDDADVLRARAAACGAAAARRPAGPPPGGTGCASAFQASSTSSAGLRWTATCEPLT